jgi:hypothetical protein
MLRPDAERGVENVFSGVSRIKRDRAEAAEMVFVINLDVLLRTSGGK